MNACVNTPNSHTQIGPSNNDKAPESAITGNQIQRKISIDTSNKSFEGDWEWEKFYNDTSGSDPDFSLTIKIKNNILYGLYYSVMDRGNRTDAPFDDKDYSFKVKNYKSNSFSAKFKDYYCLKNGTVKISVISGKLIWKIITPPNGEYYLPDTAILIRKVRN